MDAFFTTPIMNRNIFGNIITFRDTCPIGCWCGTINSYNTLGNVFHFQNWTPLPPTPLERQVIFPSLRQLALVEMRDQLRNYFRWLTEANRFGEWYKIWHYGQFVAAQSHLENVYGIPLFVSEESLPPLDYKWDISTDMWLDGTRARLICPPTIPGEVSVRITDYIGYDRGLVHRLHPELLWSRGGYIHQHPYGWSVQFPPQLPSFCTSDTSSNCRRTRWVRTTLQALSKIVNYNAKLINTVLRSSRLHHCRSRADEIANVSFFSDDIAHLHPFSRVPYIQANVYNS